MTSQLRTTAPRDCHCSAQLRPPLKGLPSRATACRYVYTGPGGCLRWPPTPPGPRWPPANNRSFTSIQMVHTHTHAPQQRGKWDDDEDEMKAKMEWKLPKQDAKRGTQEKRERANTNTTHLARNGQNPEKARKKKSEGRRTRNQTSGGGGGRKRLNQPI